MRFRLSKINNKLRVTPGWMQTIKKYIGVNMKTFWNKFLNISTYTLFYKKSKINNNSIKFKFRILETPLIYENVDTRICYKYGKNVLFLATLGNIVLSHQNMDPPLTIIPFLLVDSCQKNKVRTSEPEIHWKSKNSEPQRK